MLPRIMTLRIIYHSNFFYHTYKSMHICTLKYGASLLFGSLKGVNPVIDLKINQIKRLYAVILFK